MKELQSAEEIRKAWEDAGNCWLSKEIPKLQYETVVKNELEAYAKGAKIAPYDAFVQCLFRIQCPDSRETTFLDVGASGAYYSKIMRIAGFKYNYRACDFSKDFQALAADLYPTVNFDVEDATRLSYHDGQFDIVHSGCCMLHIKDYRSVVFESARVSKRYVLFHRQPILYNKPTTYYLKLAYGIPCVEIHFSETEFFMLLRMAGLKIVHLENIFTLPDDGGYSHVSYLCEKIK